MLLQNSTVLAAEPLTRMGGTLAGEGVFLGLRDQTAIAFYSNDDILQEESIPGGYSPDNSYYPAIKAGGAHLRGEIELTGNMSLAGGRNMELSGSIVLSGINAQVDQIVSMAMLGSITLSGTNADATATVGCEMLGSITLGGSIQLDTITDMVLEGSIVVGGSIAAGAIVWASMSVGEVDELSAEGLAQAVWEAVAADFNDPGTMGEKMNNAASAGDPWGTVVPGAYVAGTAGNLMGKLLTVAKFLGLK